MPVIFKLSDLMQRMLAAGEVIERPASVLRELLDNALDAQAKHIQVMLEQGGLASISVRDDGAGMERSDLLLSCKAHYTSKITSMNDFSTLSSLGFRGEALASISSVSKTSIQSGVSSEEQSHTIEYQEGAMLKSTPSAPFRGTLVTVSELFHAIPARKKFLRRAQVEHQHCKQVFLDKAAAFPHIHFTLHSNGKQLLNLPPSSLIQRVAKTAGRSETEFFATQIKDNWFQANILASFPSTCRKDRTQIHIFVNNRRVKLFSFNQAVEYAARSLIPGGLFPYARVFLSIDPEMVDCNTHPAKLDVKIRNTQYIHHQITSTLRRAYEARIELPAIQTSSFDRLLEIDTSASPASKDTTKNNAGKLPYDHSKTLVSKLPPQRRETKHFSTPFMHTTGHKAREMQFSEPLQQYEKTPVPMRAEHTHTLLGKKLIYLLQIHKKYLVCLIENQLTIVDQHAAHERLLYNEFRANQELQQLSVPLAISANEEEQAYIASIEEELAQLHITLEKQSDTWFLAALPTLLAPYAEAICEKLSTVSLQQYITGIYAQLACKRAIKAGDILAPKQAQALLEAIVASKNTTCPHGRPLLYTLSEALLDKKLGRCLTVELMSK